MQNNENKIDPQIYSQTFSFPNSKLKLTVQDCNLSPTIQLTKPQKKIYSH